MWPPLCAADLEIPFPHLPVLPYGQGDEAGAETLAGPDRDPGKAGDPAPGDTRQDSGSEG